MYNAEKSIRNLPIWVQTAMQACVTSGGTLGAKSLASSLTGDRASRLLEIDSKCRQARLKAMRERRSLLEAENLIRFVEDESNRGPEVNDRKKKIGKKSVNIAGAKKVKTKAPKLRKRATNAANRMEKKERKKKTYKDLNAKDVALLRACGVRREMASTWLLDEDPEPKAWTPFEKRILPHHKPWPPWPKPGILVDRARVLERLRNAPVPNKMELAAIVKDEITFRPENAPDYHSNRMTTLYGEGPAYMPQDHLKKNLAPKLAPTFDKEEHLEGRFIRGNNSVPAPHDYGDTSRNKLTMASAPGAGWYGHAQSLEEVVPPVVTEEPGPCDYFRYAPFGDAMKGARINSRGVTDNESKAIKASRLPGPGQYHVENDKILSTFHAPTAFISKKITETHIDKIMRESKRTPGPADYSQQKPLDEDLKGGRFSTAFPLTPLDLVQIRAEEVPGPNKYFASCGGVPRYRIPPGAPKFSTTVEKTPMELLMKRSAETPGPGQYKLKEIEIHGGVISKSEIPTTADVIAKRAEKIPGPPRYADTFLKSSTESIGGGRFSTAKPKTNLEWVILRSKEIPGPAEYQSTKHRKLNVSGGTISTAKILTESQRIARKAGRLPGPNDYQKGTKSLADEIKGGRFSTACPKGELELVALRSAEVPGPSRYKLPNELTQMPGGSFSTAFVPSTLSLLIEKSSKVPGPGKYTPNIDVLGSR